GVRRPFERRGSSIESGPEFVDIDRDADFVPPDRALYDFLFGDGRQPAVGRRVELAGEDGLDIAGVHRLFDGRELLCHDGLEVLYVDFTVEFVVVDRGVERLGIGDRSQAVFLDRRFDDRNIDYRVEVGLVDGRIERASDHDIARERKRSEHDDWHGGPFVPQSGKDGDCRRRHTSKSASGGVLRRAIFTRTGATYRT